MRLAIWTAAGSVAVFVALIGGIELYVRHQVIHEHGLNAWKEWRGY